MFLDLPSSVGDEEREHLASLQPSRIREVQAGRLAWTSVDVIDVDSGDGAATADELRPVVRLSPGAVVISTGCDTGTPELAAAYFAGGAGAYVAPAGAPFGYAKTVAPLLLFYELTEGRSLEQAVQRLAERDREPPAGWRLFRR